MLLAGHWPHHSPVINVCHGSATVFKTPIMQSARRARRPINVSPRPDAVLTREKSKNEELEALLTDKGVHCVKLPLVASVDGPDRCLLEQTLAQDAFQWICITSPQAAAVFASAWKNPSHIRTPRPVPPIAVVGDGTARALQEHTEGACQPSFRPSVADARHLGAELPFPDGLDQQVIQPRVLYPCSTKAGSTLPDLLQKRGFAVTRLNAYGTVAVTTVAPSERSQVAQARLVVFASPSAVKAWSSTIGNLRPPAVCIGKSSAEAARKLGFQQVWACDRPGLPALAELVRQVVYELDTLDEMRSK